MVTNRSSRSSPGLFSHMVTSSLADDGLAVLVVLVAADEPGGVLGGGHGGPLSDGPTR
jgi:hypothetical protein